jgi:arabinogalactan oligomer / maltooligosaccharide transport system permease protein
MASLSTRSIIFRLVALLIIDAFALNLVIGIGTSFSPLLGIAILVGTVIINFVYLFDRFYVWRWTAPGLALMALMVVYPLVNTVLVSFTNYGDGHLGNKEQVLAELDRQFYKPAEGARYRAAFYAKDATSQDAKTFTVWLIDANGKAFAASLDKGIVPEEGAAAAFGTIGTKNANGFPDAIGEGRLLNPGQALQRVQFLTNNIRITSGDRQIRVDGISAASEQTKRFAYDPANGTLLDRESNITYTEERGAFVTTKENGEKVSLLGFGGWPVFIGLENFTRAATSPNVRGPFLGVLLWTVAFALGSVFTTFALGLMFAIVLNSSDIPLRGVFRTILVLPYALPAFISILVWRGLLQPDGIVTNAIQGLTGTQPQWFDNATLAKIAILGVNLWLGYPYMMLISMGALQSIPGDLYEAATIDGAGYWQQFRSITIPLLLVTTGPLLIGSFAFNFNNFAIIELMTKGGPRNPADVAGQTDILISYTYRLAFGGTKGIDYGFASAITIFIFVIVAAVTIYNNRLSRRLETIYSNG